MSLCRPDEEGRGSGQRGRERAYLLRPHTPCTPINVRVHPFIRADGGRGTRRAEREGGSREGAEQVTIMAWASMFIVENKVAGGRARAHLAGYLAENTRPLLECPPEAPHPPRSLKSRRSAKAAAGRLGWDARAQQRLQRVGVGVVAWRKAGGRACPRVRVVWTSTSQRGPAEALMRPLAYRVPDI